MGQVIGDPQPVTPGDALVQELLWVHDALRRDLRIVQRLAERVRSGAPASEIRAGIESLQTNSALWKFRSNCLFFCRFVHGHHALEDMHVFPRLRESDPALNPVVDRLEADHRVIAVDIRAIEQGIERLSESDTPAVRDAVSATIDRLGERLLEHLAYEEEAISPTLRTWDNWI